MMNKKYIIICFVFLFTLIPKAIKSEEEKRTTYAPEQTNDSVTAAEEIPPEIFSFRGVTDLTSPVRIELKEDVVDSSAVIQSIERVKESHYYNQWLIRNAVSTVNEKIRSLCQKSKDRQTCQKNSKKALIDFRDNIIEEMSNRILYPPGYGTYTPYFKESLETTIALLDSNCNPKNCSIFEVGVIIRNISTVQYNQLYDKIKNQSETCQKDILTILAEHFKFNNLPEECLKKENKNHQVCRDMLRDIRTARDRFLELAKLAYGEEILRTTEAQAICLECISEPGTEMEKAIKSLLKILHNNDQCLELKPGEEKIVHPGTGLSSGPYLVRREQNGSYSIPLTFEFFPGKDYDGPVPREEVPDYYMRKVQGCMQTASQQMLGPNGEKLSIIINKPVKSDSCKAHNVTRIPIISKKHRGHYLAYTPYFDCPTITHEILHILGLCDEYKEPAIGFYVNSKTGARMPVRSQNERPTEGDYDHFELAYDCRVTQLNNSIMSIRHEKWKFVFEKEVPRQYALAAKKENSRSLLHSVHFNSLLYGGCPEKNKFFNECSQLAYSNSFETENCMEKKRQCESQNLLGMNKQEEIKKLRREINHWTEQKNFYQNMEKEGKDKQEKLLVRSMKTSFMRRNNKNMPIVIHIPQNPEDYQIAYDLINQKLSTFHEQLEMVQSWPD